MHEGIKVELNTDYLRSGGNENKPLKRFPSLISVVLLAMRPPLLCSDPLHCNQAGNIQWPKYTEQKQETHTNEALSSDKNDLSFS